VGRHRRFLDKHGLHLTLLSDPQKITIRQYAGTFLGITKRKSFLIDPAGNLRKIYASVKPKAHAREVLQDLEGLTEQK